MRSYSSLRANIQDEFNRGGVEIMSPQDKTLRERNSSTIPKDYLPGDYLAPRFRTEREENKKGTKS